MGRRPEAAEAVMIGVVAFAISFTTVLFVCLKRMLV